MLILLLSCHPLSFVSFTFCSAVFFLSIFCLCLLSVISAAITLSFSLAFILRYSNICIQYDFQDVILHWALLQNVSTQCECRSRHYQNKDPAITGLSLTKENWEKKNLFKSNTILKALRRSCRVVISSILAQTDTFRTFICNLFFFLDSQPPLRPCRPCVALSRACAGGRLIPSQVWAGPCTQPAAAPLCTALMEQGRTWHWDQKVSTHVLWRLKGIKCVIFGTNQIDELCCFNSNMSPSPKVSHHDVLSLYFLAAWQRFCLLPQKKKKILTFPQWDKANFTSCENNLASPFSY